MLVLHATIEKYGGEKEVVVKATNSDLFECLQTVADNWLGSIGQRVSVDRLKEAVCLKH